MKLIFDGCSTGNPGDAGVGSSLRDHKGNLLGYYTSAIPKATNNIVEALALLYELELAKNIHVENLDIVSD